MLEVKCCAWQTQLRSQASSLGLRTPTSHPERHASLGAQRFLLPTAGGKPPYLCQAMPELVLVGDIYLN